LLQQLLVFIYYTSFEIKDVFLNSALRLFSAIFVKIFYMPDQQPSQLNIEISEEVAEGTYANLAIITHSHAEFVIDFVNVMPGTPKSKVKSRLFLLPCMPNVFSKPLKIM
jgi:hypothetical protein